MTIAKRNDRNFEARRELDCWAKVGGTPVTGKIGNRPDEWGDNAHDNAKIIQKMIEEQVANAEKQGGASMSLASKKELIEALVSNTNKNKKNKRGQAFESQINKLLFGGGM